MGNGGNRKVGAGNRGQQNQAGTQNISGANQQSQQICQGRKCYQNNRRGQGSQSCAGGICHQDNGNGGSNQYKPSERGQFQSGTRNRGQNQPGMQQSFPNSGFTGNGGHGQDGTRNGGHNGGNGQVGTRYGGHGQVGPRNGGYNQAGNGNGGLNQGGKRIRGNNQAVKGNGGHSQVETGIGGSSQAGRGYRGQNQAQAGNGGHSQGGYQQKCSNGSKCQVTYGDYDEQFFTDDFWGWRMKCNVKLLSKALILILIQSRYNFDPKNLISIKRLLFKFYSHLLSIKKFNYKVNLSFHYLN